MSTIPYRLGKTWHPDRFQGTGRSRRYFEGWYFKLVSGRGNIYALIPGVSIDSNGNRTAFIQVIDGLSTQTAFHAYEYDEFSFSKNSMRIRVGSSTFVDTGIEVDIDDASGIVSGAVRFGDPVRLRRRLFRPGIMGWYAFVPFMECRHGIVSLDHTLDGRLRINDQMVDFTGGRGYIEKDWGRSFPSDWVWLQSNSFGADRASVMVSIARIPWLGRHFVGFLAVVYANGRIHRLATYTGASLDVLNLHKDSVEVGISARDATLSVSATREKPGGLKAPIDGAMDRTIAETVISTVTVRFSDGNGTTLFSGTGTAGGLEVAGDPAVLQPASSS